MGTTWTIALEMGWLALLGVTEVFAGAWPRRADQRRRARNLGFTVVNHVVIPPAGLLCAAWVAPWSLNPGLTALPVLLGAPLAIMLLDFVAYWLHRALHRSMFFWRFHQIHHLDEDFDVTTGTRVHTVESAIHQMVIVTVAAGAHLPVGYLVLYGTVAFALDLFHHTNVAIPAEVEKWLRRVIITPGLHVAHHRDQIEDTDTNYGFIFSWWDQMFGTYNTRPRTAAWRIGLDYSEDLGFIRLMIQPVLPTQLKVSAQRRPVLTVVEAAKEPVGLRPAQRAPITARTTNHSAAA